MCRNNHSSRDSRSSSGGHHTFLWGLVAGAVLGVLFAPDNGESTRKKLKKVSEDLADKGMESYTIATEKFESFKETAIPIAAQLEEQLGPILSAAKETGGPLKDEVVETISHLLKKYGHKETILDKLKNKL